MNFMVGQLLIHCSETLAFWLFVTLIEEYDLRDIFQQGLPGLQKHSYIMRLLIMKHLPEAHHHLEKYQVKPEMWASELIFSAFTMVLPEKQSDVTATFFDNFFRYRWEFFYKLILTIIEHVTPAILASSDILSVT
jgi:hypothetical protein